MKTAFKFCYYIDIETSRRIRGRDIAQNRRKYWKFDIET